MIVGESGSGKSSLLRAIAGLVVLRQRQNRPAGPSEDILFLPQRPYMILGVVAQPAAVSESRTDRSTMPNCCSLLQRVNLPDLAERFGGLDAEMDWEKVLSVGEQQRLAFARVLLTRPSYVMLDEATSALDIANEEIPLSVAGAASRTTMVSVSHRATILKFHKQVLELAGDGAWQLHPAQGYSFGQ